MQLRKACKDGEMAVVAALIGRGASVHSYDEAFERTPLHFAAQAGHRDICALLVKHGAAVDAVDISCVAPLHLAAERGYAGTCEWLCRSGGASVCAKTPSGSTALHYAANNNHRETAAVLLAVMKDDGFVRNAGGILSARCFKHMWCRGSSMLACVPRCAETYAQLLRSWQWSSPIPDHDPSGELA